MRGIIALLLAASSPSAHALISKIEITSFRQAGNRQHTTMAELCGRVSFENESVVFVDVTVDRSVRYTVPTDPEGRFCLAVDTRYGQASATARSLTQAPTPAVQVELEPLR
jgi:hypothetical protein